MQNGDVEKVVEAIEFSFSCVLKEGRAMELVQLEHQVNLDSTRDETLFLKIVCVAR